MSPAPHENRTDLQLVAALNAGDAAAFDVLYFRHRDWAMRLAMRFTGHHDDALVLKQATFSRLFGVNNRAATNENERVAGVTLS